MASNIFRPIDESRQSVAQRDSSSRTSSVAEDTTESGRNSATLSEGDAGSLSGGNKHMKKLTFANPGKFMENFDPERSARELRKMNRRIFRENIKKNQLYDDYGRFIEDSSDLCDCLEPECPGCHFECPKCGSQKCGADCRCQRKWFYEKVEIEGGGLTFRSTHHMS